MCDLAKLAEELEEYGNQLSVIRPMLTAINDENTTAVRSIYGQLELIGVVTEHINTRLGDIADQLKRTERLSA